MKVKFYDTVEENLLHNLLEVGFKYITVSSRELVISEIQKLCPFKVTCDDDFDILTIDLGGIYVKYKLIWETRSSKVQNNVYNTIYYLKDIQIYDKH